MAEWNDREWTTVSNNQRSYAGKPRWVTFGETVAAVPVIPGYELAERATWATDGGDGLRLRVGDAGELGLNYKSFHRRYVTTSALQKILNRPLRGKYPVASIEGNCLYIDLSEPLDQEGEG